MSLHDPNLNLCHLCYNSHFEGEPQLASPPRFFNTCFGREPLSGIGFIGAWRTSCNPSNSVKDGPLSEKQE